MSNLLSKSIKPIILSIGEEETRTMEGQCDACPPGSFLIHKKPSHVYENIFYVSPELNYIPLNEDFSIIFGPYLPFNPLVVDQSVIDQLENLNKIVFNRNEISDIILQELLKYCILIPENQIKNIQFSEINDVLTVMLQVTDECNLSCDYCYIKDSFGSVMSAAYEMPLNVGKRIIYSAYSSIKSNNFKKLKIKYSGGEPLLYFTKIEKLHKYALKLANINNIEIEGSLLSNGSLLNTETIKKIKDLNMRLMISLDGLDEYHNCQRHYPDGSSSFEAVIQGIELAVSNNLIPDISITITNKNIKGLAILIKWLLKKDLPFSINFCRRPFREDNKKLFDSDLEEGIIISEILRTYGVIEEYLQNNIINFTLLGRLADRVNFAAPHLRPCGMGHSYMVFDWKGNLFKCQMDNRCINESSDLSDDHLDLIRENWTGIENISVEDKAVCKACLWRYWCAGGCPLQMVKNEGAHDTISHNCKIYKALCKHIIRLEGARILSQYHLKRLPTKEVLAC
jgi:uncharacterized protein